REQQCAERRTDEREKERLEGGPRSRNRSRARVRRAAGRRELQRGLAAARDGGLSLGNVSRRALGECRRHPVLPGSAVLATSPAVASILVGGAERDGGSPAN